MPLEAAGHSVHMFRVYKQSSDVLIAELGRNRLLTDIVTDDFEKL